MIYRKAQMTDIKKRKQTHIDTCISEDVEYSTTYLDRIKPIYKSLPECNLAKTDIQTIFLDKKVSAPFFISSMTGGAKDGKKINRQLAEIAGEKKIPLGLGSIRILFEHEEVIDDFLIRSIAPEIPMFANLGAVQLKKIDTSKIFKMLERLEVDAIALHLNPAQELCQKNGETDFESILSHINLFTSKCPIPVIIKETGFGILPTEARQLLGYGAKYVDISGSGGTNWAKIEHISNANTKENIEGFEKYEEDIYELGIPTGILMLALYKEENILASGGIRTALEILKCIMLGAKSVGLALPVLQHLLESKARASSYIDLLKNQLKKLMVLCGIVSLEDAQQIPFYLESDIQYKLISFCRALNIKISPQIEKKLTVLETHKEF